VRSMQSCDRGGTRARIHLLEAHSLVGGMSDVKGVEWVEGEGVVSGSERGVEGGGG